MGLKETEVSSACVKETEVSAACKETEASGTPAGRNSWKLVTEVT